MRSFYIGVTLLCGTYAVGHAEERLAEKPQCATLVAKVVHAINATFDRYSPSGQNVFLSVSVKEIARELKLSRYTVLQGLAV